jgi:iron(III) transport system ATP-binding protein
MDEPFSNLDTELREQLAAEVRALLKRNQVTAILVTHDQHEAFAMADHVTLLQQGRIAQSDTPYNLYHQPANEFVAGFIGQGAIIDAMLNTDGELNNGLGGLGERPRHWPPGEVKKLLVRPDDIQYAEHSTLQLAVTGKSFRGAQFLYELALPDGQRVLCLTPSHVDVAIGNTLAVGVDLRHAVVFDNRLSPRG